MRLNPTIPVNTYHDSFGNFCHVIRAPAGRLTMSTEFVVQDGGEPDPVAPQAEQHDLENRRGKFWSICLAAAIARPIGSRTWRPGGNGSVSAPFLPLLRHSWKIINAAKPGQVHALVRDRHRSREFVEFLKLLDAAYPTHTAIKLILDNHSAHISKETKAWLAEQPTGRFEFTFTPKHGSWLNLVEGFFSKLARSVLRHIRVASKQELKDRIMAAMDHFNRDRRPYLVL
jgi:transposase